MKVLIVDDSRLGRMMTEQTLRQVRPDWSVGMAASAEEALALVKVERDYALGLIDQTMPGMGGLTLVGGLRALLPNLRIALVTASIQDSVRQRAQAAEIGFIDKPITPEKLESFLRLEGLAE